VSGTLNYVRYFSVSVQGTQGLGRLVNLAGAGIAQECRDGCMLTYPEVRYAYDARDNIIEPTQGFFTTIGLQQTVKPGNFSYFRINPEFRAYTPATRYAVLALRAMYGGLFTTGDSPFTQRFFLGGQNDMRGYSPLRQGPKLGVSPCDPAKDKTCTLPFATQSVPIGGNAALLFSAELRIHADALLNHLGIVTFVDASHVGDDPRQPFAAGGLEVAPGVGLRYITPFGPIRFDVAWLANPKNVSTQPLKAQDPANPSTPINVTVPTTVSSFCPGNTAGCIHESRFAFHLTLGEAF
jgi:translocation and assembly module TamA